MINMITDDQLVKLAEIIISKVRTEKDDYLPPARLSELIPAMSRTRIASQIRAGKYGKKIGEKGKLVAKPSEVKKYNRL